MDRILLCVLSLSLSFLCVFSRLVSPPTPCLAVLLSLSLSLSLLFLFTYTDTHQGHLARRTDVLPCLLACLPAFCFAPISTVYMKSTSNRLCMPPALFWSETSPLADGSALEHTEEHDRMMLLLLLLLPPPQPSLL
jgi:hypothetical protein